MFKIARPLFLICETPLHAGSGDALGVVDLPIQRERHTGFPKIEASSLKGAIREAFEDGISKGVDNNKVTQLQLPQQIKDQLLKQFPDIEKKWEYKEKKEDTSYKEALDKDKNIKNKYQEAISLAFGPEETGDSGHAGALGFTDARLLLFPVKSMKGVFAWITCPRVLRQFEKDMKLTTGFEYFKIEGIPDNPIEGEAYLLKNSKNKDGKLNHNLLIENSIVLEEYTFTIKDTDKYPSIGKDNLGTWLKTSLFPNSNTDMKYWADKIESDIVILSDDDFTDFVNLSTEVITRTAIDNVTGTVKPGALFTEEFLPSESILYSLVLASPIFQPKEKKDKSIFHQTDNKDKPEEISVMDFFEMSLKSVIQVGGNATLGKGIVRTKILNANSKSEVAK